MIQVATASYASSDPTLVITSLERHEFFRFFSCAVLSAGVSHHAVVPCPHAPSMIACAECVIDDISDTCYDEFTTHL